MSLDAELYLHEPVKKKREVKFGPRGVEVPPECRVMSLTSFSLTEISQDASVLYYHYLAVGCSDTFLRYMSNVKSTAVIN